MRQGKGPEFIRFFRPIIQVMRNLGGSGTASEIVDRSLEVAQITEAEQQAVNKNGFHPLSLSMGILSLRCSNSTSSGLFRNVPTTLMRCFSKNTRIDLHWDASSGTRMSDYLVRIVRIGMIQSYCTFPCMNFRITPAASFP